MNKPKAIFCWSGGKDSCYAMMQAMQLGYQPKVLLNMVNENGKVSRSHGLPAYKTQTYNDYCFINWKILLL